MSTSVPDRLRSLLAELVAFDTQNPSGDERPMVQWLATQLGALGAARVETIAAHAPDEYVELAQLIEAHDAFVHVLA